MKKHNTSTPVKPYRKLRQILAHPKDKIQLEQKCNVIYEIPCKPAPETVNWDGGGFSCFCTPETLYWRSQTADGAVPSPLLVGKRRQKKCVNQPTRYVRDENWKDTVWSLGTSCLLAWTCLLTVSTNRVSLSHYRLVIPNELLRDTHALDSSL